MSVQVSLIKIRGQCARSILARMCHGNFIWRELIQLMCCWTSKKKSDDKSVLERILAMVDNGKLFMPGRNNVQSDSLKNAEEYYQYWNE